MGTWAKAEKAQLAVPPASVRAAARPVDGHIPAYQCLGRRGRVSDPNSDAWREILTQQEM
jgi:hypothetical protein